jgi:hypothetical protein
VKIGTPSISEHHAITMEEPDLPHMWLDLMRMATGGQESILKICRGCGGNREGLGRRGIEHCNSTIGHQRPTSGSDDSH